MFSKAYKIASKFTLPLIISQRTIDDVVSCSWGACVIVNEEGWFVTVAHVWDSWIQYQKDQESISDYMQKRDAIEQNGFLNLKAKNRNIQKLKKDPKWITESSVYFGIDGVNCRDVNIYGQFDLAVGKLEPFDPAWIETYPVFKNSDELESGTSLCKLGFPFTKLNPIYDPETCSFNFTEGFPMPLFPIEGIFTRHFVLGKASDGRTIKFIETSSPGLPGQSGGPIFDKEGVVWGIQSKNIGCPLFSNLSNINGKTVEEPQFLNVGIGVHPEIITAFLSERGINFSKSD